MQHSLTTGVNPVYIRKKKKKKVESEEKHLKSFWKMGTEHAADLWNPTNPSSQWVIKRFSLLCPSKHNTLAQSTI